MLIRVGRDLSVRLEAPEDLKRFKLMVEGGTEGPALAQALGEAGRLEGEHVWVSPDWLRRASGHADDADWQAGFAKMVEFAARQGWVNEQGAIRAHVERE